MSENKHTPEQMQAVRDAIAAALGDAYDCTRVWAAWGCGTMGPDDFVPVAEDDDRLHELTIAVLDAAASVVTPVSRLADAVAGEVQAVQPTAKVERELTEVAQAERDQFELEYGFGGNCSCHLSPPCGSCTHPGNPLNQEEDDDCWQPVQQGSDS